MNMMIIIGNLILGALLLVAGGPTRTVDEQEIKNTVEQFVQTKLTARGVSTEQYAVEYRSAPRQVLNVAKNAKLQIVDDGSIDLRNGVMLPVEIILNGHIEHTFLVSLRIRRFGKVLVATERIERNQPGKSIVTRVEAVETTTLPSDVIMEGVSLEGKRAKRYVKKGSVLTKTMFEPVPTVTQGSPVTLLVKTNSVVIKSRAIAREDGATGEIVVVQKAGTGDRFRARVIDEHTVEMSPLN